MRSLRQAATGFILAMLATGALAQPERPNLLGLHSYPDAPPGELGTYTGPAGRITVYALLTDPWNPVTELPIADLGGFAFRVVLPSSVFLLAVELPEGEVGAAGPDFVLTGAVLPVPAGRRVLATLEIGAFSVVEGFAYLAPTAADAPLPDACRVLDAADPEAICPMVPGSGSYEAPVFAFWPEGGCPPVEVSAWGGVKSLWR